MLTTTLDGLWILQVLTGTEVVAPELGLRPHLPSVETRHTAMAHPVAADLSAAGVIDEYGSVDDIVREWLTVLARRDLGLLVFMQTPHHRRGASRAVLVRFAQWWVLLERSGGMVRMSGVGTATSEAAARTLIGAEIGRLLGEVPPAPIRPVTLDADALINDVGDRNNLGDFLIRQRLDNDQVAALLEASSVDRCTHASIVAIQSGIAAATARSYVEPGAVTVIDSPAGRLVTEHLHREGRTWMIVGPGSAGSIGTAVQKMLRRLPAQDCWHSFRKAV